MPKKLEQSEFIANKNVSQKAVLQTNLSNNQRRVELIPTGYAGKQGRINQDDLTVKKRNMSEGEVDYVWQRSARGVAVGIYKTRVARQALEGGVACATSVRSRDGCEQHKTVTLNEEYGKRYMMNIFFHRPRVSCRCELRRESTPYVDAPGCGSAFFFHFSAFVCGQMRATVK
ncbi:unnamed protein product [Caenorhabditis auriculariae]|uniref:Uncharacterized protein n=1 Tax=Caenorhabditis auriculariae TaxID=2777116 RepID=A0A8S1HQT0_9PELO|nr:unnamed protein product [Caenorhabditis auriculariae]